jgi:acetyl-CoA carboxylase biotin carboxylase subunit
MTSKILIANRGEIAVRIIRACRELSIPTVAAYSSADRTSLHVQLADEAICIGPPAPIESYLNIDSIINAAQKISADAIHPGYGFLAENHNFAKRCEDENIIFIGPNSTALKLVGDKLESRQTMEKAGIPIIPGMKTSSNNLKAFAEEAKRIGYPVLVKASLGGGGKAMRTVWSEKELDSAIEAGMREAKSAFGDDTIYLEKYIEQPRHIEFQVLADKYGNAIHLFERECSIQRRHQKIVEETPSVAINDAVRKKMGQTAIKAIKAAGYTNAGTVEFLLDKTDNFYFLEVNARLQVEHPITEFVTGVDLVKQQIQIANDENLSIEQSDLKQRGHAIECRIYAEDPANDFLPSPGKILFINEPTGPGIRVDSGIYSGYEVSAYYDPILSKVIAWGEDRETARNKMIAALSDYTILGIKSTIEFEKALIMNPEFIAGKTYTSFINDNMKDWHESDGGRFLNEALMAAAIDSYVKATQKGVTKAATQRSSSPWQTLGKWEIASGSRE